MPTQADPAASLAFANSLRELHRECLDAQASPLPPAMALALRASFGDAPGWHVAFAAVLDEHRDTPGWAVLAFQSDDGSLRNQWIAEGASPPSGGHPLLAIRSEPGPSVTGRETLGNDHIDTVLQGIAWASVHARYQLAVNAASESLGAEPDQIAGARLLDVRRAEAFEQADSLLPGADWLDPGRVSQWRASLVDGPPVIVYCVHGHEVSRATAMRLRAGGVSARFLHGGIEAWKACGLPLQPKGGST